MQSVCFLKVIPSYHHTLLDPLFSSPFSFALLILVIWVIMGGLSFGAVDFVCAVVGSPFA